MQSATNIVDRSGDDEQKLPEWWGLYEAAERLNCPPWELLDKPQVWQTWAMLKASVEQEVRRRQENLQKGKKGKGKRGRGRRR